MYQEKKSNLAIRFAEDGWKYEMERKLVEVLNTFLYLVEDAEPDPQKGSVMMLTTAAGSNTGGSDVATRVICGW